jgi:hypothetical protein
MNRRVVGACAWTGTNGLVAALAFRHFDATPAIILLVMGTYVSTLIYLNGAVRLSDQASSTVQAAYSPVEPSPLKAYVTLVGAVLFGLLMVAILLVSYVLLTNQTIE